MVPLETEATDRVFLSALTHTVLGISELSVNG